MKTITCFFLIVGSFCINVKGQSTVQETLDSIFKQNQKGYTTYKLEKALYGDSAHYAEILWLLKEYYSETNISRRNKAYQITKEIGLKASDDQIRSKAITSLVQGLGDKNKGVVGMIINYLFEFTPEDFNSNNKSNLQQCVRTGISHYEDLIRLTGYVNISELIPFYQEKLKITTSGKISTTWAMHLALAKMGDQWEADYCLQQVKKLGLREEVVLNMFPDLVYINYKPAFNYLLETIMTDSKNCRSPQPDVTQGVICAFKVMELVANHVEGFPVTLNAYNEIETDDYDALLLKVRDWIRTERNK